MYIQMATKDYLELENYLGFLTDVDDGTLLFKDSEQYASTSWRPFRYLSVSHPIQRKLTERECVFDFDGVNDTQVEWICKDLQSRGLKFVAWRSSANGLHIHYWTDVRGKMAKKSLVKLMAKKVEDKFNIQNDIGPMMQEMIRSEWSIHPKKGDTMKKIFDNLPKIDPINIVPTELKQRVYSHYDDVSKGNGLVGSVKGKSPSCMRYILSHKFTDGRKRLQFIVMSWFKGSGLSNQEVVDATFEWCKRQGLHVSKGSLLRALASNTGSVGCRYRHELLEELGVDHGCDGKIK